MLAASMIDAGMNWWQSLVAILLGNAIVLVPLVINAHDGTRYGLPFPVFARAEFGTRGAHIPALLRAVVACGWFGIQTWIGGLAINALLEILWPEWRALGAHLRFMGDGPPHHGRFLLFLALNLFFVPAGAGGIQRVGKPSAPLFPCPRRGPPRPGGPGGGGAR